MRQLRLQVGKDPLEGALGAVLAHDLRRVEGMGFLLRKGHQLRPEDLPRLAEAPGAVLHLVAPEAGDLHEEAAGLRLADAVAGPGVRIKGYVGAQYQLVAQRRGLLHVDTARLEWVNALEGLAVFTLFDSQPVEEGALLAGVKVVPLVIGEAVIRAAEAVCQPTPPLQVRSFQPMVVGVLVLEEIDQATRARFRAALERRLSWFGASLGPVLEVENEVQAFVAALRCLREAGVDVIMAAGAGSLDPLEPLFLSLREVGATIEKHGAPVHPGSLFWFAYLPVAARHAVPLPDGQATSPAQVPVFGLSSCEMFSHKTVLDLVLPRVFAGERVDRATLVALGHGGLLTSEMAFRFPPYGGSR